MPVNTVAPTNPAVGLREGLIPSYLPEMFGSAAGGLEDVQRALLNILEDLNAEKASLENGQRAFLNILEDSSSETTRLEDAQRAALNILEDFAAEKGRIEDANRAYLNILDDSAIEKGRLEDAQRAVLNMLDDFSGEKARLEDAQRAALNILDDFDFERGKVEQINQQLAKEIQERKVAQEQLVAANHELEAFAYSVSHDLRAPLRHIDGYTRLLEKGASTTLDEKHRRYLNTISESAQQMGTLIDDLLAFSRVGRSEMRKAPVSLDALVTGVLKDLQDETKGRDIVWNRQQLPDVYGDASMLRQVLANLISNALKYTRTRAQAQITIGSSNGKQGETVVFIEDNGVGFDMQYADKLFGVFQRLHRADEFEGTGIGLANVRRIIQRHGGRTWAQSSVDGGATFYFSLPDSKGG